MATADAAVLPRVVSGEVVLGRAATLWLATVVVGQAAFLYYIAAFYGVTTVTGDFASWTTNTMVSRSYVAGDAIGNLYFAAHVLLAGVVAFGGVVQLVPQIRNRCAVVHRWNGRIFLTAAMTASLTGLWLVWLREGTGGQGLGAIAISLNGMLTITFAVLAWRAVRGRDFAGHRRWAMRTVIAANGVWFIRLGFMVWVMIHQGPFAIRTFANVWGFGSYLLPLAVLELYLRVERRGSRRERHMLAGALVLLTLLMAVGIAAAFLFLWRPVLETL